MSVKHWHWVLCCGGHWSLDVDDGRNVLTVVLLDLYGDFLAAVRRWEADRR